MNIIKKEKLRNLLTIKLIFSLKTGLFKWKKDYESALMYFGDAGCYYFKIIMIIL